MKKELLVFLILSIIFTISCDENSDDVLYISKDVYISTELYDEDRYVIYWDFEQVSNFKKIVLVKAFRLEDEEFFDKALQYILSDDQNEEFEDMYNCSLSPSFYLYEGLKGFIVDTGEVKNYCTVIVFNFNGTYRKSNTIILEPIPRISIII